MTELSRPDGAFAVPGPVPGVQPQAAEPATASVAPHVVPDATSAPWAWPPPVQLKPLGGLATAVQVLSIAQAAVLLVSALLYFADVPVLRQWIADGAVGSPPVATGDLVGYLAALLLVAAGVCTAVWAARARANSEAISAFNHERSAVWAWLGWFVPVVMLWFPYQVLRDNHRGSTSPHYLTPPRLGLFWGVWVASASVSNFFERVVLSDPSSALDLLAPGSVVVALVNIGALLLWLPVVRSTTRVQEQIRVDPRPA